MRAIVLYSFEELFQECRVICKIWVSKLLNFKIQKINSREIISNPKSPIDKEVMVMVVDPLH